MSDNECSACGAEYSDEELGIDPERVTDSIEVLKETECPNCGEVGEWYGAF